jgi:hypothetical protein
MNTKHSAGWTARSFAAALAAFGVQAHATLPLITDDTRTQGAGRWQLELSGTDAKVRDTRADLERYDGQLSYGLGETVDLEVGAPWYRSGEDGVGDTAVALKWRFLERGPLSFGLKPGFTVPTGDERDGHGTGRVTWSLRGILSYQPGAISAHAHAGYRRNENKLGQRESLQELAASIGDQLDTVRFVGELTRETNPVRGARTVRYSTLGAIWSATRDVDLSAGWRQGHGGAPIDEALILGATLRW